LASLEYSVILNLAALLYQRSNANDYSTDSDKEPQTWIQLQNDTDSGPRRHHHFLERRFFLPQSAGERSKSLTVDLA
jgi:hypothetical protein